MRKLTFGMNLSLDGYIAAPDDDLGWSVPSVELFQWWSDRVGATGLALYGRNLWETMSSHWPTADQQPGATPAQIEFAHRWRDMPKVVFSSTTSAVDWNARLVTGAISAILSRTACKTSAFLAPFLPSARSSAARSFIAARSSALKPSDSFLAFFAGISCFLSGARRLGGVPALRRKACARPQRRFSIPDRAPEREGPRRLHLVQLANQALTLLRQRLVLSTYAPLCRCAYDVRCRSACQFGYQYGRRWSGPALRAPGSNAFSG